jgi:hypothetical protein
MMDINMQTIVANAIFYANHGDPLKDYITDAELLKALTELFTEIYGRDYIAALLEYGEFDRLGWPKALADFSCQMADAMLAERGRGE